MSANNNIIRQITDIQAQAERLTKTKPGMAEVEQFAKYNDEIKSFLINNIDDDFILKYVKDIPDLNLSETETKTGVITLLFGLVFGGLFGGVALFLDRQKAKQALTKVKRIGEKYASAEFMLKNYFAS